MTQGTSPVALYYPWTKFQDDNWLKLALLTWDNVARIRPQTLADTDNEIVRQLAAETDFIIDIMPSAGDLRVVRGAIDSFVDDYHHEFDVHEEFSDLTLPPSRAEREWRSGIQDDPTVQSAPPRHRPKRSLIWVYTGLDLGGGKADGGIIGLLSIYGLAVGAPDGGPWIGMHPKMASIYLTVLADTMAQSNNLCPVTDDPGVHVATGALDRLAEMLFSNQVERRLEDAENAYVHLALNAVITPERLAHLPVSKLIAFRNRYSAELAGFRQHVGDLAPELRAVAEVENMQVAHAHLEAIYNTTTKPQLDELRSALRGMGIGSASGVLDMKLDLGAAAGTVLGAAAAAGGQMAVAGASVAVTVLPYLARKINETRELKQNSPVAYLLAAHKKLSR
ncbi:DUF6236 family protein [Nocardia abscessus]|uniref:DUF6236 family protein n=1 Tax=Nocardia abscessus TaxID=120957 RepID=UPI0024537857|nr:DUF6236 family protein [Nocardia abscessus]